MAAFAFGAIKHCDDNTRPKGISNIDVLEHRPFLAWMLTCNPLVGFYHFIPVCFIWGLIENKNRHDNAEYDKRWYSNAEEMFC